MSDLNTLIESWKRSLADLSNEQADELEDHLRSEIDALKTRGELTAVEAFAVAAMRVGRPTELAAEFDHADAARAWSLRLRWMVLGFLACMLLNAVVVVANMAVGMTLVVHGVSTPIVIMLRILSLSAIIMVVITAWQLWLRRRAGSVADVRPPRWLLSPLALMIGLMTLPWVDAMEKVVLGVVQAKALSVHELGRLSVTTSITDFVLPFTAPLILFIAATTLDRRHNPRRVRSEG